MPLLLSHRPVAGPGNPPASNLTDRRRALCSLGAALLVGGTPRASRAQGAAPHAGAAAPSAELATPGWPNRPLRMMVGFGAGSTPDLVARLVAEPLSQALGQPVIVENHAGASGNIAAALVARASDLHTIGMLINGNMTIARLLNPATPYEPQKDLQPLSLVCVAPMVLAASVSLPGAEGPGFAAAAKSMGNRWSACKWRPTSSGPSVRPHCAARRWCQTSRRWQRPACPRRPWRSGPLPPRPRRCRHPSRSGWHG
jgi:hypothetical protein